MPGEGYGLQNPVAAILGFVDVATPNEIAHTNLEYLGFNGMTDGALAATGVFNAVPIAVQPGDVITNISILAGATAEATGTHAFAALYSGIAVPALLGQSADNTGAAAIAASAAFKFPLATVGGVAGTSYVVKPADAPNGFIYAGVAITAGTVPTVATITDAVAVDLQWNTNAPLFLSMTAGSALAGTPAATLASPAVKATIPVIVLT